MEQRNKYILIHSNNSSESKEEGDEHGCGRKIERIFQAKSRDVRPISILITSKYAASALF